MPPSREEPMRPTGGIYIAASLVWLWLVEVRSQPGARCSVRALRRLARSSSLDWRLGAVGGSRALTTAETP
jgi:hypothetical protein